MIKSRFFLKYALIGSLLAVIIMGLSMEMVSWIRDAAFERSFRAVAPFGLIDSLLGGLSPEKRIEILKDVERNRPAQDDKAFGARPGGMRGPQFCVTDSTGTILFPFKPNPDLGAKAQDLTLRLVLSGKDAYSDSQYKVVKLSGLPEQFFISFIRPPPPPRDGGFLVMALTQAGALILAVVITIFMLIYTLRARARMTESVIHSLSHGNLKARFPITKMDEVGQVMFSFNKMADEIEHLIETLRKSESARKDLLRQLAHDLRTPIASIKSLIEIVKDRGDQLTPEKREELLELALREGDYFQGLVEDLLFLGAVNEPHYKATNSEFDLRELVEEELQGMKVRFPKIQVQLKETDQIVSFNGDASLIKRLVRNALENAFSFAKSTVEIGVESRENEVEIKFADDGPGFGPEALSGFGQRKFSRAVADHGSKRISIGLGSVIMKSITDAYRGILTVTNASQPLGGAEVKVTLPKH